MKIIYNSLIPFKGFVAINLFGVIFARKEFKPLSWYVVRHELCHSRQISKDGLLMFYLRYLGEYIVNIFKYGNFHEAYRNISYEIEAYNYERL